jgi:aspartate-semialdehyde dehydrogenase
LAVIDPVSAFGKEAIETLARQAVQRVQGAQVEDRIHGQVLAFNVVAVEADELQEDGAILLPDLPLAITRTLSGCFHGHLAHLGLSFEHRLEVSDLRDALAQADAIEITSLPLSLDSVPDQDRVLVTSPWLSPDGTQMALTMMADGLRVGSALTAVEILESLL